MSMYYGISSDSVSTLFSSLGSSSSSSSGSANGSILAEYAMIRNGSYLKLTKAYYGKMEENDGTSESTDTAKELTNMKGNADELVESADALLEKGSKSLFKTEPENRDDLYAAVESFIEDYNTTIDASKDANNTSILTAASSMTKAVQANKELLASVGIEVDNENKMTIDEADFKEAQWSTIKSLFNGNGSFAYNIKAKASYLSISATNAASKTTTYTGSGYKSDFDYSSVMDDII